MRTDKWTPRFKCIAPKLFYDYSRQFAPIATRSDQGVNFSSRVYFQRPAFDLKWLVAGRKTSHNPLVVGSNRAHHNPAFKRLPYCVFCYREVEVLNRFLKFAK